MLTGRISSGRRLSALTGMSHHIYEKKNSQEHEKHQHDDASDALPRGARLRLSPGCLESGHTCDGSAAKEANASQRARRKKSSSTPSVLSLRSLSMIATTGRRRCSRASLVARNCAMG